MAARIAVSTFQSSDDIAKLTKQFHIAEETFLKELIRNQEGQQETVVKAISNVREEFDETLVKVISNVREEFAGCKESQDETFVKDISNLWEEVARCKESQQETLVKAISNVREEFDETLVKVISNLWEEVARCKESQQETLVKAILDLREEFARNQENQERRSIVNVEPSHDQPSQALVAGTQKQPSKSSGHPRKSRRILATTRSLRSKKVVRSIYVLLALTLCLLFYRETKCTACFPSQRTEQSSMAM